MHSLTNFDTELLIEDYITTFIQLEGKNEHVKVEFGCIGRSGEYHWKENIIRFDFEELNDRFFSLKYKNGFEDLTFELFVKWVVLHEYCHSIDEGLSKRMTLAIKEHRRDNFRNVSAIILMSEIICYKLMRKHIKDNELAMFRLFKNSFLYLYKKDVVSKQNFWTYEHPSKLKECFA